MIERLGDSSRILYQLLFGHSCGKMMEQAAEMELRDDSNLKIRNMMSKGRQFGN